MGQWLEDSKDWFKATLVRVIRTCAATALGSGISTAKLLNEIDWGVVWGTVGLTAVFTILTALAGLPEAPSPLKKSGDG